MKRRRVVITIGVPYQTALDALKKIPGVIETIVGEVEDATFGRAHFAAYGQYSLNFEIVYFVESANYDQYMDINQNINLRIKEEFEKLGVQFAYPTQRLFVGEDK